MAKKNKQGNTIAVRGQLRNLQNAFDSCKLELKNIMPANATKDNINQGTALI